MRILIVNYRYFISGGPEKYMFNIIKVLQEHGHEVIPFSVHSNKNVPSPYENYFVEPIGNRDATYFEECKKTPRVVAQMLSRSIYSLQVKKAIQKEIREVKPDLVYILHFVNKLSPSVIRGAKELGIPVVVRLSDYFLLCPRFDFLCERKICEDCLKKGLRSCIRKRCVKNSLFASAVRVLSMKIHNLMRVYDDVDAFVTPSKFLKTKLSENGFNPDKIYHIPTFAFFEQREKEIKTGTYGLYFGRLTEEKGVETVIKAYEKIPDQKLVIMGDDTGEEALMLKRYVKEKKMDHVEFIGFCRGEKLEEVIRNSQFVVIPSIWYDNLPNTALEAFRYSKPIIASRIGSLPELVSDGENGFLFEPGNAKDLLRCICRLSSDETARRLGANGRRRLEEKFSPQNHYEELNDIFEKALNEKSRNGKTAVSGKIRKR